MVSTSIMYKIRHLVKAILSYVSIEIRLTSAVSVILIFTATLALLFL